MAGSGAALTAWLGGGRRRGRGGRRRGANGKRPTSAPPGGRFKRSSRVPTIIPKLLSPRDPSPRRVLRQRRGRSPYYPGAAEDTAVPKARY